MEKTIPQLKRNSKSQASNWAIFSELIKLRLTALVLITTLVGFYAGLNKETGGLADNLIKLALTLVTIVAVVYQHHQELSGNEAHSQDNVEGGEDMVFQRDDEEEKEVLLT